ncbi:MAG TPA: DegQ family serine endoprotease [Alphaproteobacteria bacterium]|jgi:serine protease Do
MSIMTHMQPSGRRASARKTFARKTWRRAAILLAAWMACTTACTGATQAQAPAVPQSREQVTLSFAPVVKRTASAVVNIYARTVVQARRSPLLDDPFFRRFFGDNAPGGAPRERVQNSLGSGVIVDPSGLIVTNYHVIGTSGEITVVLPDRREFNAKVELADERADLAVLRIDTKGESLPVLPLRDSDDLEVGDLVLAIGNPFGVGQTVTSGIVSALARTNVGISDYGYFIQTDAAINPGNSGGALVGMDGSLVGINTAIYSQSGGSLGIGFAIPSNMVRAMLASVKAGGKIVRPWLGANGQAVTAEIATSLNLPHPEGVLISGVNAKGPASRAGLRVGDIVTAIDGRDVDSPEALRFRIATLPVGKSAKLTVLRRSGEHAELTLALESPPETPARDQATLQGSVPLAGATVANLSPALADELALPTEASGVIVMDVGRGSIAARLGLKPRDVVVSVNGADVESVAGLRRLMTRNGTDSRWRIAIRRGDQVLTLVVG